jgi:hypothetical protein
MWKIIVKVYALITDTPVIGDAAALLASAEMMTLRKACVS